jgi:alpha-beta hydrolase superfamily lysophospholipase
MRFPLALVPALLTPLILTILFVSPLWAVQLKPQLFSVNTKDSVILKSDIYSPINIGSDKKVVLLLHMLGHNRRDYDALISPLTSLGFEVIALDLRGHGQSTKRLDATSIDYKTFDQSAWAKLPNDIEKVIDQIIERDGQNTKIYIIGASIGANTAAIVGAKCASVPAVILLSPGLDYKGLKTEAALAQFKKPAFIVASKDDEYSFDSSNKLKSIDNKLFTLKALDNAGHGTDMLMNDQSLMAAVVDWLKKQANIK